MRLRTGVAVRYMALATFAAMAFSIVHSSGVVQLFSFGPPRDDDDAGLHHGRSSKGGALLTTAAAGQGKRWHDLHQRFVGDIGTADLLTGLDVVFYGDSIVESWRGTELGVSVERAKGIPDMWGRHFGEPYHAKAFGIANDQTGHLLWRLKNGELPRRHAPRVIVLLVGTTDVKLAHTARGEEGIIDAADGIGARMEKILDVVIRECPDSQVILLGILPRGFPDDAGAIRWPSKYARGLLAVNARYEVAAAKHEKVQYIDCGAAFLINDPARPGGRVIDARLMPDGVHPSAVGMDVLGLCLDPTVAYLKSHPHAGERKKFADEVDEAVADPVVNIIPDSIATGTAAESAAGVAAEQAALAGTDAAQLVGEPADTAGGGAASSQVVAAVDPAAGAASGGGAVASADAAEEVQPSTLPTTVAEAAAGAEASAAQVASAAEAAIANVVGGDAGGVDPSAAGAAADQQIGTALFGAQPGDTLPVVALGADPVLAAAVAAAGAAALPEASIAAAALPMVQAALNLASTADPHVARDAGTNGAAAETITAGVDAAVAGGDSAARISPGDAAVAAIDPVKAALRLDAAAAHAAAQLVAAATVPHEAAGSVAGAVVPQEPQPGAEPGSGALPAGDPGTQAGAVVPQTESEPVRAVVDAGVQTGAATQTVVQPLVTGAAIMAGEQAAADVLPVVSTAAAGATATEQPNGEAATVAAAQQRRQVVASPPTRRRQRAPLTEAQQRLQEQWQAKLAERLLARAGKAGVNVPESDLRIIATAKLPRTVFPVEAESEPPASATAAQ